MDKQIKSVIDTIKNSNEQLNLYDELAPIYEYLYADGYNFEKQASIVSDYTTKNNPTVIDLGCGTGDLINILSKNKGYYIGIDLSEKLLKNARSKNSRENTEYINMDYNNLDSIDKSVDTYCSFGSLTSHTKPKEMKSIMNKIYNTLSENGNLIIDYHSPISEDGEWKDSDGDVVQWEKDSEKYIIKSTIITVNRGNESHYTVAYEITNKETKNSYTCSQKIPIQFYTKKELKNKLENIGFKTITHLKDAPDRSGVLIATK